MRQYNDQLGMVDEWASMEGRLGMVELRVISETVLVVCFVNETYLLGVW